ARERGTSVYFPRRVIPMLPEALSNELCSLKPKVDRLCLVCEMEITADGAIARHKFYSAVMHSRARLTYTQVWNWLSDPKSAPRDAKPILAQLTDLYALFHALKRAREARGAIDFDSVEMQLEFDVSGKIVRIVPVVRNDAHKLIEECMLAANVCTAEFLAQHKHPALYRVHEGPTPEKLAALRDFLASCALSLPGGDDPTASDYAQLLLKIKDRPDYALLQTVLLRSLQQARYRPDNVGHFGLSYEAYAHFTSPIRRYPDLLVHRAIKAVLANQVYKPSGSSWTELGVHCSLTERRADDATRDVENWLKCYFMQDRVGETFDGTISGVTNFGVFVTLDGLNIDGLVHVTELGRDYFHFDAGRHAMIGERTGRVYQLAGRVRVKVARVDLETTKIDFTLAEDTGAAPAVVPTRREYSEPLARTDRVRKPKGRR
ncbi:MAG: VacB/RNase II family 3'-5' exoribonuclease, partial [Betaproteobacteria bacterium]